MDFALKFVVTEKDILLHVMMETILMVMDVAEIVEYKSDFHVMEVLRIQKICALHQFLNKLTLKIEDNRDFLERLFSI